ncbi:MAG: nucleoside triphosphate pyrophosphohydrolase family protein [Neptuniibacter sp.]
MEKHEMDFDEYQAEAAGTFQFNSGVTESKMISILGLSGEVGELATEYKKVIRDGDSYKIFREKLSEELGDILWYLSSIATQEDILLSDIAKLNVRKIKERWHDLYPEEQLGFQRQLFDDGRAESEQLPRSFVLEFYNIDNENGKSYIGVKCNGKPFGNELRDNAYEDDYYRFHDIFHFSYVVVLGWSPVVRRLLGCKRKSDDKLDEIEDGGRASVIDEGVSIMIFEYARNHNFFEGAGGVDYSLLRTIKNMTHYLEVGICTPKEWEDAILLGFEIWRELRTHKAGKVICDLYDKTMIFESL